MISAQLPQDEEDRLKVLSSYNLLDTNAEDVYDEITKIAIEITGTSMSSISLIDKNRQWLKSKQGMEDKETSRETSFCAHAILNPGETLIVPDARYDERFFDNPQTIGKPHIIFYAGVPLVSPEGFAMGSLCVMDSRPREIPQHKLEALKALAKMVQLHFELRKTTLKLNKVTTGIKEAISAIISMEDKLEDLPVDELQLTHIIQSSIPLVKNYLKALIDSQK